MQFTYDRIYIPIQGGEYCITNKQQHILAKKYPGVNVVDLLNKIKADGPLFKSGNKLNQYIDTRFNGAYSERN